MGGIVLLLLLLMLLSMFIVMMTKCQVLSYATIVRYLVYQQGKEIDLLVGTLRDLSIGTFTRSFQSLPAQTQTQ